jgi:tetratricopeptide (TPR) repeat protein
MLAVPLLFFLVLEGGLRLAGFGDSYPLFVSAPSQPDYLFPNPEVARRYFRPGSIVPLPQMDFFRAHKAPGSFRIFFQGESSAAGFPYRHGGAPSRMLAERLQATFPDRDVEVVNTALTAVNSYTLLDQSREIIAQKPDAVMIYTGHNEFYGVFGVGSSQSGGRSRALVKAYLALRPLRTVQLLARALSRAPAADASARSVMELMAGEQLVPYGSPRYRAGLAQFRANLSELLARYQASGIPVLIGTVASNDRGQRPFASELLPGTERAAWERAYHAGVQAMARGDTPAAERALHDAVRIDSTAADAFFALARCAEARGDVAGARAAYRAARDRDQLRFRAPEDVNRIIREEAARHGAVVVDTRGALERASPGGVVGDAVMLEHLHPNVQGYFVIADAFYQALRAKGMIGPWTRAVPAAQARAALPLTAVDSLVGVFRADRLRSGWPFQPRGTRVTPVVDTLRPRAIEEELALGLVRETMSWPEATDRLRDAYERAGDREGALRAARAMAQEFRADAEPAFIAGRLAFVLGRNDEALRYARAATERGETAQSAQLLGFVLLRLGDHAGGARSLRRAAALDPNDQGISFAATAAEAIPRLEQARARTPRDPAILFNLANAYAITQQFDRSREALAVLREVEPEHAGARDLAQRLP